MNTAITIHWPVPMSVLAQGDEVGGFTITAELAVVIGEPGDYTIIEGSHDDLRRMANLMRTHLGSVAL